MILILDRNINVWLYFLSATILSCFFAYINLSEFIQVGVFNNTESYTFGGEGPVPWYYKTKELYASVTLIFGLLFSIAFFITLWAFIRNKKARLIMTLMTIISLVIIQLVTGQSS